MNATGMERVGVLGTPGLAGHLCARNPIPVACTPLPIRITERDLSQIADVVVDLVGALRLHPYKHCQLSSARRSRSGAFWPRFQRWVSRQALEYEEVSPEESHTEERAREAREGDGRPQRGVADRRRFPRGSTRPGDDAAHRQGNLGRTH